MWYNWINSGQNFLKEVCAGDKWVKLINTIRIDLELCEKFWASKYVKVVKTI